MNNAADVGTATTERRGPAGLLWLRNQTRRNALSPAMLAAAWSAWDDLIADPAVAVVFLRGAGGTFVSGADLGLDGDPAVALDGWLDFAAALRQTSKPVVAVLEGWCLGGGVVLAIAADLRIATSGLRVGVPTARLGAAYPLEWAAALVDLVGPGHAAELLLTGETIDAARCAAIGFVNRLAPDNALEERIAELARSFSANAPLSMAAAKSSIAAACPGGDARLADSAEALLAACRGSGDFLEGRAAFREKRPPRFRRR